MKTKKIVLGGFFVGLGVLIPMIFHMAHMGGPVFLPMHIPVLLAGFLLGGEYGFLVGLITPIISSIITGMPPIIPTLPIMTVELSLYGFIAGVLFNKSKLNSITSLVLSMICGRAGAFLTVYIMANILGFKKLNTVMWIKTGLVTGIPGIVIQLILIPTLLHILTKSLKKDGVYALK